MYNAQSKYISWGAVFPGSEWSIPSVEEKAPRRKEGIAGSPLKKVSLLASTRRVLS